MIACDPISMDEKQAATETLTFYDVLRPYLRTTPQSTSTLAQLQIANLQGITFSSKLLTLSLSCLKNFSASQMFSGQKQPLSIRVSGINRGFQGAYLLDLDIFSLDSTIAAQINSSSSDLFVRILSPMSSSSCATTTASQVIRS